MLGPAARRLPARVPAPLGQRSRQELPLGVAQDQRGGAAVEILLPV